MQLSLEGIASKAISKADFAEQEMMVRPYYKTLEKKPAATTLASVRGKPVIAVHRVGRGRVCLLNVSKLFRWYQIVALAAHDDDGVPALARVAELAEPVPSQKSVTAVHIN